MKNIYKAELLKLKHSKILGIVMFLPLFFVVLGFGNFIRYRELFTSKGQNIWNQIYTQSSIFYGLFIIALFITILVGVLVRIENSENNFKRILALPVKRSHIYVSKLLVACGMVFLNLFIFTLLVIAAGVIAAPVSESMPKGIIYSPLLCFAASLPVISIQYYLTMKFQNIAVPLGIGVVFSLPSVLINNTKYWILFPWTYPGRVLLNGSNLDFGCPIYIYMISLALFVIFATLGMYEFNKKDI